MPGKQVVDAPVKRGFVDGPTTLTAESGDFIGFAQRKGYHEILAHALTVSNGGVRLVQCPQIRYAYWYDDSATGSAQWQLLGANTTVPPGGPNIDAIFDSAQSTTAVVRAMATADFLYFATDIRTDGYYFDLGTAVSNNVAVMTLAHGNASGTWTAATIVDLTKSSNTTLAIDGTMTITTAPAEGIWVPTKLQDNLGDVSSVDTLPQIVKDRPYYWARLDTSAVLDDVDILHLLALDVDLEKSSTKGDARGAGFIIEDNTSLAIDLDGWGGYLVVGLSSGTPDVHVTWIER